VLVVDDDPMVRRLLGKILDAAGIEVAGEAADGDEVVPAVQAHHPDVVLMDLKMPRMGGVVATAAVRALPNPPAVVALTAFDTPGLILDAVRAGADGFLAKDAAPDELVAAVRDVGAGEGALSPRAARILTEYVHDDRSARDQAAARERLRLLTEREREIAEAVAAGLTNAQIAARAYVSEATVKTHLGRALTKLGLANRTQLALVVDRAGTGT
jgi:DNA-binding NarL/FixJ family response regulator